MKKTIIYSLGLIFILALKIEVYAQEDQGVNKYLPNIIPPSPDAAALGKYGEFPVSLYTGTPNISVPIGEVSGHAIKVPISLSYHASGVKVEDIAPWTGLGWTLNAGGVITRVVKGKADDHSDGYFNTVNVQFDFPVDETNPKYLQFLYEGARGVIDTEPDLYIFNFMGYSGKFFIDANKKIHLMPHKDIKITPPTDPTGEFTFETGEWEIITEDGTIYKFGGAGFIETTYSSTYGETSPSPSHVSGWYLKEISRQDRIDKVTFEYQSETIKYDTRVSYTDYDQSVSCINKNPLVSYSEMENLTLHLEKIKVNGKLAAKFNTTIGNAVSSDMASFTRKDIYRTGGSTAADALKEIEIYALDDEINPVKKFMLEYDHFESTYNNSNCNWVTSSHGTNALNFRLRLKSVKEVNTTDYADKKLLSAFTYNDGLPSRCSMDQDHWGYYNDADNSTILPSFPTFKNGEGGNREVNPQVVTNGMLNRIDFPTGGYTEFEFKPHRREINETIVIPEPRTLTFEVLDDPQSVITLGTFTLSHTQDIEINYTITHPTHGDLDSNGGSLGKISLVDGQGTEIKSWSAGGFNNEHLTLTEDTYSLKFESYVIGTDLDGDLSYEVLNENGTGKNKVLNVSNLGVDQKVNSGSFILAKTSSILFNITANEALTTANVNLYKEGIFVQLIASVTASGTQYISTENLVPGEYTFEVHNTGSAVLNNLEVNAGYLWHNISDPYIGGLKITRIESYDGTGNAPIVKQFNYELLNEVSPIDQSSYIFTTREQVNANCPWQHGQSCGYPTRVSTNRSFLGATQGSPVGYEKVTTIFGENAEMGIMVDEFTFHSNVGGGSFPFPGATEFQWRSGLLKKQTVYNAAGVRLKETSNEYQFIPLASLPGQKVAFVLDHPCYDFAGNDDFNALNWDIFTPIHNFNLNAEWVQQISSTETVYDQNDPSKFVTTSSTNHFKDVGEYGTASFHGNLLKTVSKDSKGQEIITEYKYPLDVTFSEPLDNDAETARLSMVSKHVISPVLETIVSKTVGNTTTLLSKTRTNYKLFGSNLFRRNIDLSFTGQPYESRVEFQDYDENGNLLRVNKIDDAYTSYLWGYDNTLPIAKIAEIQEGSLISINTSARFTSFETEDNQALNDFIYDQTKVIVDENAPTGEKVYQFNVSSQTISKSGLNSNGRYILSFWAKGNSVKVDNTDYPLNTEWKYYEIPVTGISDLYIQGDASSIDELRIFPEGALMTTYTYKPMVGITSVCDANNIITYYKYDEFGRLQYILDADRNILKKHEYQYGQ